MVKNSPVKGAVAGSLSRRISVGGKPVERSISSSPSSAHSSMKGKKNTLTNKHSGKPLKALFSFHRFRLTFIPPTVAEAMDFRDWCENECVRLVGSRGTQA